MEQHVTLPDEAFYQPNFSPWLGYGEFKAIYDRMASSTLLSPAKVYVLYMLARQALFLPGDFIECGVYKGGSASLLNRLLGETNEARAKTLHLFDTFEGMPDSDPTRDTYARGHFGDTSIECVRNAMPYPEQVRLHQGLIPHTFAELEADARFAFAHVDVDLYSSYRDCCEFIYPRLVVGGFLLCDDYALPTCPGARQAVDEYFSTRRAKPLVLATGQAIMFRSFEEA
ncbi:O-methyltransferase [Thermosporothrix hazakensis]|jgi:O-methyltransferase|uniref:O-methyltransferase n=1 Tax=Thermosporothrix hazakensis TaxID=644383 RepID=A0A326UQ08_THEHA|nr:TylF/MycF/NovP-related O-methyltransferase [Thermosporothrix hazakensis]PZW32647.1 O-methyltransferase [Thermosporothrix hazakensis]GCE50000.1 hypothetical protein KTH_48690 [Thermosporothrix hazakensis]